MMRDNRAMFLGSFCAYALKAAPKTSVQVSSDGHLIRLSLGEYTEQAHRRSGRLIDYLEIDDALDPIGLAVRHARQMVEEIARR